MKYIYIQGDTNDADYVGELSKVTDKQLKLIEPVMKAIGACKKDHNYPKGDMVDDTSAEDMYGDIPGFDEFDNLVPYGEHGIHTIERIEVLEVSNKKRYV